MKTLKADKCKDGWLIMITDRITVGCESDVFKTVRENGLKIRKELCHKPNKDNPNEFIYAD